MFTIFHHDAEGSGQLHQEGRPHPRLHGPGAPRVPLGPDDDIVI